MLKKKITDVHLPSAKAMSAALADVRAVQARHDARLMFLVFCDRVAHVGSQLKALGIETDETLKQMLDSTLEQAKKAPRVAPKQFNPDAANEGKPS